MTLSVVPVTFAEAKAFVAMWHRHHKPPVGHKFSVGVASGETLEGAGARMSTSEPPPPEGAVAKEPVGPRASIRPHDDGDEIKPWDDDHTALVHVLWHCHHAGLTLKDDFDEVASQIRQSKYHRAVVAAAFQAGALQNAVPDASLSAPPAQSAATDVGRAAEPNGGPYPSSAIPSDGA